MGMPRTAPTPRYPFGGVTNTSHKYETDNEYGPLKTRHKKPPKNGWTPPS